jgi:predicted metal-dependent peptidase
MSAEGEMLKARANMILDAPFFGTLALKLKLIQDDEKCKTCATDGKSIMYNGDFVTKKISNLELRGVIAHEVLHCTGNHGSRRKERDPKVWNAACDYAINPLVIKSGFVLPTDALLDDKYDNLSPEAIYPMLIDEHGIDKVPSVGWGTINDPPADASSLEADWQIATTQAIETAKAAGKMPGHLESFLKDIVKPRVDWRSALWPFCSSIAHTDYSFRKPNRAYISEDEYLPSLYEEAAGELALIVDTSGSCMSYYDQFMSEFSAIHRELRPTKVHIITCDYEVQDHIEIEPDGNLPEKLKTGGGGTRFSPAFDYVTEKCPEVEAAVYLTDLESNDFGEHPPYPVLWVATTNLDAPWGQLCKINMEES